MCEKTRNQPHLWTLFHFSLILDDPRDNVLPYHRAIAASAMALLYLEYYDVLATERAAVGLSWSELALPSGDADRPLYIAAHYADLSAYFGLMSAAVLRVGTALRIALGAGGRAGWEEKLARRFPDLAYGLRQVDAAAEKYDARRRAKVAGDPGAYVCAARGCGVQGRRKAALWACGGPCKVKPHYCSEDCQKRVSVRNDA